MKFIQTVRDSIYNPSFYQTLNERTVGKSIRYFLLLSFVLALLSTVAIVPDIFAFLSPKTVDEIVQTYPSDLEIRIKEGKVSTNQQEPYVLPGGFDDDKANLLVIDTKTPLESTQFAEYSTHVLLKQDFAIVADDQGGRLIPLDAVKDFALSRAIIASWAEKFYPYLMPMAIGASLVLWLGLWIANLFTFIYLLLAALLVMLLGRMMKQKLSYKESYRVALYAVTLPLIIATLLGMFSIGMPFLTYTLLLLVVVYANLRNHTDTPPSTPVSNAAPVLPPVAATPSAVVTEAPSV